MNRVRGAKKRDASQNLVMKEEEEVENDDGQQQQEFGDNEAKKKRKKSIFEEPENGQVLKQMLADRDTSAQALKWLAHLQDSSLAKSVVKDYCQNSTDFHGILRLLSSSENVKRKIQACAAIEALLLILSGEDDKELTNKFATAVCNHESLKNVASLLATPNGHKPVLKLLTALVVSSAQAANLVVANFNWDQFRKSVGDSVASFAVIRSCLGYLALALILHAEEQNEIVVTAALTGKCRYMFDILFAHLGTIVEEDPGLVNLLIDTLLKKVADNPRLGKTTKMKLFNEENTERILRLLTLSDQAELAEVTLTLIRRLFTDTKLGVVFFDAKFGNQQTGKPGNANILATKIIGFLISQQNGSLLTLLVDILSALPDQIPHYFDLLKSHAKKSDILMSNAAVIAQLPPVATAFPHKSKNATLMTVLNSLCLPESPAFLDQARLVCKAGPKQHWETIAAPLSFLAALLQRCFGVFSLKTLLNQDMMRVFFWRVKRSFVDPDKVLNVAFAAADFLKKSENDANHHDVVSSLNSCILYLIAHCRFSSLLVLSFPIEKLINAVSSLAQSKENRKLRKMLARFCLTVGLAKDWVTNTAMSSSDDSSLLRWIIEEAAMSPNQHALILSDIFLKLSEAKTSQGEIAVIIATLCRLESVETSNLLVHLYEGLILAAKKPKQNAASFLLKHLHSFVPENQTFVSTLDSLKELLFPSGNNKLSGHSEDPLTRFVQKVCDVGYDSEEFQKCIDSVFFAGFPALNDILACFIMRWLIGVSNRHSSVNLCLGLLFKRDRNLPHFLRMLTNYCDGELTSIGKISHYPSIGPAVQSICRFIQSHPENEAVCLARTLSSPNDDSLFHFNREKSVKFFKKLLKQDDQQFLFPVGLVASLCRNSTEITNLAEIVSKKGDLSKAASILRVLLFELNHRGDEVDKVFVDFGGKIVFSDDNEEMASECWNEGADLLFEVVAASPRSCCQSLRTMFCSASLKSLKRLISFWQERHDGKASYPRVCSFLAECIVTTVRQNLMTEMSQKLRQRLFGLITVLLPVVLPQTVSLLFQCGTHLLANLGENDNNNDVPLNQLLSFINGGDPTLCTQRELSALLNRLASGSSSETIEIDVAIKAVTSSLKAVDPQSANYHQFLSSLLSSLLSWSGINSKTMMCIAESCARVDVGAMKTRQKTKLVTWLVESIANFQGTEKWMVNAYIAPVIVQCAFSAPELVTDDFRSLIDTTESLLFDESGNPHDLLLRTISLDKQMQDVSQSTLILRCLHAVLWFRGPSWRCYSSVWRGVVPVMLANYTATLSERDQIILSCLAMFDNTFDDTEPERALWPPYQPCVWGAKSSSGSKQQGPNAAPTFSPGAMRQTADVILDCLSPNSLLNTAMSMPIDRSLFEIERCIVSSKNQQQEMTTKYDPAFLVSVFARTLGTQNWPMTISRWVSSNVLAFLLAALSLKDDHLRALAYTALAGFESYATKQRKQSQPLLQFFDVIRRSIPEQNTRVAPVMATFLARLPAILFGHKTASAMAKPLNSYLRESSALKLAANVRPTIPANVANAFYYTSDIENARNQRAFLLDVASTGVRDLDAVSQSRDGFSMLPMLAALLNSPLCSSASEYLLILQLFTDLAGSSEAAVRRLTRVHRLHLMLPTYTENEYVIESGNRLNADKNKTATSALVSSMRSSLAKGGIRFPVC